MGETGEREREKLKQSIHIALEANRVKEFPNKINPTPSKGKLTERFDSKLVIVKQLNYITLRLEGWLDV